MHVDDASGAALRRNLALALDLARRIMEDLLGPGAVAHEKTKSTESQPSITVLGYELDMSLSAPSHTRFPRAFSLYSVGAGASDTANVDVPGSA